MASVPNIRMLSFWKDRLGLLPIPMFVGDSDSRHYVLLNGSRGNFCLSLLEEEEQDDVRSHSWSSDVGHYLQVVGDFTEVRRWDYPTPPRRFSNALVARQPERFHTLLEREQPPRELSVIARMMRTFRSLRSALGPEVGGTRSLEAFLCFIACASDGVRIGDLALDKWSLSNSAQEVARLIDDNTWQALLLDATSKENRLGLQTHFDLVLRHASGQLFQEAHYHAAFVSPGQMMLSGFAPSPVRPVNTSEFKGLHFTPPSLARSVVEEALSASPKVVEGGKAEITVFDPACGSGEFLREALRLLELRDYQGKVNLIGWDISTAACSTSRFVLKWEARYCRSAVNVSIAALDSLRQVRWPANVDFLLMNPPFVSWEDMNSGERETVANALGPSVRNKPDMASAFLRRAALGLAEGGVLGAVLPASILSSGTADKLRSELSELLSIQIIGRLGSQQLFSNAIVDPTFMVAVRGKGARTSEIALWADHRPESSSASLRALRKIRQAVSNSESPTEGDGYSIYRQPTLGKTGDDWVPRRYKSWKLFDQTRHLPRVSDFFDVHQGIRTGANDVFVLAKEQYDALPSKERRYFRGAVVNSSIRQNVLNISSYVFYPYGQYLVESESQLASKVPKFFANNLFPNKQRLIERAKVKRERWWELTWHRTWQVQEEPKLVSTYFGDSGSFAIDAAGSSVVMQGYGWFPKGRNSQTSDILYGLSVACLTLLASSLVSDLLASVSNHVGGGQWDLSTRFVNRLPLPDLLGQSISADLYGELVRAGENLSRNIPVPRELIDALAVAAYGLNGLE